MANPRTPLAKAVATGRVKRDPQRFRDRREPKVEPLGEPSEHLNELERKTWREFVRECPWLKESDRALMEIACRLRALLRLGLFDMKTVAQLRSCLNAMGVTPVLRERFATPDGENEDPGEAFFN